MPAAGGRSPPAQHGTGPESDAAGMRVLHLPLLQPSVSVGRLLLIRLQNRQAAVATHLTALIISRCLGTLPHPLPFHRQAGMKVTVRWLSGAVAQSVMPYLGVLLAPHHLLLPSVLSYRLAALTQLSRVCWTVPLPLAAGVSIDSQSSTTLRMLQKGLAH